DRVVLLRRVTGCRGTAQVRVMLQPSAGFGRDRQSRLKRDGEVWSGRSGRLWWRWSAGCEARTVNAAHDRGEILTCEITVEEGSQHDLVLELSEHALPDTLPDPEIAWDATTAS